MALSLKRSSHILCSVPVLCTCVGDMGKQAGKSELLSPDGFTVNPVILPTRAMSCCRVLDKKAKYSLYSFHGYPLAVCTLDLAQRPSS